MEATDVDLRWIGCQRQDHARVCRRANGTVLKRDVAASDPEVLAKWLSRHCKGLVRVVLEMTGPLSTFLFHGPCIRRGILSILSAPAMREACWRRV
jgi:hypothetical protein